MNAGNSTSSDIQPSTRDRAGRSIFRYVSFLIIGALTLFARCPDYILHPQFWAEDSYFFERQYTTGLVAMLRPYSGYLHFVPRTIAAVCSLLDPRWIPLGYVLASLAVTLYVASRTLSPRFPFPAHWAYFFAVLLVPDAGEVLLNPTNLQSITVVALVLVVLSKPPVTKAEKWHDLIAVFVLGLTGPHVIALLPFFAARVLVQNDRFKRSLLATAATAAGIQIYFLLTHPMVVPPGGAIKANFALPLIGARIGGALFWAGHVVVADGLWIWGLAGVATIAGMLWLGFRKGDDRRDRSVLILCALALVVASLFRIRNAWPEAMAAGYGARYFFFPQLAIIWMLIHGYEQHRWLFSRVAAFLLVFAMGMNFQRLQEPPRKNFHWENYVDPVRNHEFVVIPVNPTGWLLTLNKPVAHPSAELQSDPAASK